MKKGKLWTPEFLSMSGGNFFIFISQYIMIVALPIFIMDNLGGNEMEAGMAMTCFQIGTISMRPFAGPIIDSVNKRRLLRILGAVFIIVLALFNVWQSELGIYTLRLLHGLIFGILTTTIGAVVAMILPAGRKGEGIGYYALSTNLAMVVGPLIGLVILGKFHASVLFLFMTVVALLTAFLVNWRYLPDQVVLPAKRAHKGIRISDFIEKNAIGAAILGGLVFFAYGGVLTFIPLYAKSLGMQDETSLFFAVFALIIVVTRPFIGRLFDTKGPDYTVYPGFISFAIGMFLFGCVTTFWQLMGSALILGFGFGALSPAFQTLAIKSAPPSRAGVATATYFWSLDICVGLAAAFLSIVATMWGYHFLYSILSTLVIIVTAVIYYIWSHRSKILQS